MQSLGSLIPRMGESASWELAAEMSGMETHEPGSWLGNTPPLLVPP